MSDKADKPKHTVRNIILGVIGLIVVLAIIGAITSSSNPTVTTTPTSSTQSSTASNSNSSSTPAPSNAKVGDTINIGGSSGLAVALVKIFDPAQGADQYTTADAGKRFVAVELKITNNGTSSYNDDANNNATLIGSDNQSYTSDLNNVSECTNFSNGQYTLAAGESSTGCVTYQLPNGVNTTKIQFQTNSGMSGNTGEWTVQ